MAQADGVVSNGTGSAVRSDINNQYAALWSNHSGSTEPSSGKVAYQFWADTNTNIFKIRNSANNAWISLFTLAGGIDVDAASNFNEDVTFTGAAANVVWDKSTDDLIFNDGAKAVFGTSSDGLLLYHSGSHSYIKDDGTGKLRILSDDVLIANVADSENIAKFTADGAVEAYYDNSLKWASTADGTVTYGTNLVRGAEGGTAQIRIEADEGDDNADKWRLMVHTDGTFDIQNYTSGSYEVSIRCEGDGATKLNHNNNLKLETTSTGIKIHGLSTGTGNSTLHYDSSSGQVTYDTSSRLVKTDIADSPYGIDIVKQLKPRKYKRTDQQDTPVEIGFIADEVQSLIPEIVPTGPKSIYTKDASDTEVIPINVEYQKLTVVLTTALQEAITKIETLENKVAALES